MFRHMYGPLAILASVMLAQSPVLAEPASRLWLDGIRKQVKPSALTTPAPNSVEARLKWYADQLKNFPNQAGLHYQLGLLQLESGKPEQAAASLAMALKLNPGLHTAAWQLAEVYLKQGKPEQARLMLESQVAGWQVDSELDYLLGLSYLQLGMKSQALSAFEKVTQLVPGHVAIKQRDALRQDLPGQKVPELAPLRAKADSLIKLKQSPAALAALQELLRSHPEDKASYARLAGLQESVGQFAAAAPWREQLQVLDACYEDNSARLGRWLLWTGFLDRAAELMQNQLECRPTVETARWLGQLYRQRGSAELAQAHYSSWLKRWPGDAELLSGQAAALLSLGRLAEARASLAQIKVPGPEALFVRSQLALQSGQPQDAIRDLKIAVAASNRPEYHKALALAYVQAGMGEPARLELGKYLQAKPAEAASLQPLLDSIKLLPKRGRFEN